MARTSLCSAAGIALFLAFAAPAEAVVGPLKQPNWVELTPPQREILAPLSAEWDKLESYRRKKWLGIAQRYPTMTAEEQQRLQRRMQAWIKLTPEERKQARERYKSLQKAPPEQRQTIGQKWQEYKDLPEEEKEKLQRSASHKAQPKTAAGKKQPLSPALKPLAPTKAATPLPAAAPALPVATPAPQSP